MMEPKVRVFIDALRMNSNHVMTGGQVADALETLFASPMVAHSALNPEQLQLVLGVALGVGINVRAQLEQFVKSEISKVERKLAPHLAQ